MSNAVSALQGAVETGGLADIRELGLRGMITLRGDLSDAKIKNAATGIAGTDMPGQREITQNGARGIAWMSPDELLVMVPHEEATAAVETMTASLAGMHALAVNVSDARAVFEVSGPRAREVMAKLAPVDFAPASFTEGMFRRSRMAQVPAAFWMSDEDTFTIVCFRSVALYMFDLLCVAAQPGSEVDAF